MTEMDVFTSYFKNNAWSDAESLSGPGSTIHSTKYVRRELPILFNDLQIKSILDLPCGDFNWFSQIPLGDMQYTGGDIVIDLIQKNKLKFANAGVKFEVLDITQSPLPTADLVICRDCFVHFSFAMIRKAIENLIKSNSRWLLATHFDWRSRGHNIDIKTGDWRPINLSLEPFNFPIDRIIIEGCDVGGDYADKSLALIDLHALKLSF